MLGTIVLFDNDASCNKKAKNIILKFVGDVMTNQLQKLKQLARILCLKITNK